MAKASEQFTQASTTDSFVEGNVQDLLLGWLLAYPILVFWCHQVNHVANHDSVALCMPLLVVHQLMLRSNLGQLEQWSPRTAQQISGMA